MTAIWNDIETLKQWFEACAPERVPSDAEYVDFDAWPDVEASGHVIQGLRGNAFVKRAATTIRLATNQSTQLMTGFRGSGKTTELRKLAKTLRAEGYYVVEADARKFDNFTRPHTIVDLTLVLAAAVGTAAESGRLNRAGNIFQRMASFLTSSAQASSLSLEFPVVKLQFDLKNEDFREQVRGFLENQRNELRAWFHGLVADIREAHGNQQVVILIDGLEKYDAADPKDAEMAYRAAASLFENFSDWLELPDVHTVYCVPPLFSTIESALRARYDDVHPPLSSVRIRRKPPGNEICEDGVQSLITAMSKRVDLGKLFGDHHTECATAIALASGGHVRDLFLLLRTVIRDTMAMQTLIGLPHISSMIAFQHGAFGVTSAQLKILQQVKLTGTVAVEDFGALTKVFDDYLVFAYANGEHWFALSPLGERRLTNSRGFDQE